MDEVKIKVFRHTRQSIVPTKGHPTDAGLDLYACRSAVIRKGRYKKIETGVSIVIPAGYFGLIRPRSGLSVKFGTDTLAGVVDAGYTGPVDVVLSCGKDWHIKRGDRIAQLLILPVPTVGIEEVSTLDDLEVDRGNNGFGSTGV